MSIEDLCKGDTVVKQAATHTKGRSGGNVETWADSATLDCTIQTMSASESRQYQARGFVFNYTAFFSSDPGLTENNRLKWTVRAGTTLSVPIYLRVLNCYSEGEPGEDQLWIADLSQETTRSEA